MGPGPFIALGVTLVVLVIVLTPYYLIKAFVEAGRKAHLKKASKPLDET